MELTDHVEFPSSDTQLHSLILTQIYGGYLPDNNRLDHCLGQKNCLIKTAEHLLVMSEFIE